MGGEGIQGVGLEDDRMTNMENVNITVSRGTANLNTRPPLNYRRQEHDHWCGPAIVQMFVPEARQKDLAVVMKVTNEKGTHHSQLKECLEVFGFTTIEHTSGIQRLHETLNAGLDAPVVCYYLPEERCGHFAVVHSIACDYVFLIDPYFGVSC